MPNWTTSATPQLRSMKALIIYDDLASAKQARATLNALRIGPTLVSIGNLNPGGWIFSSCHLQAMRRCWKPRMPI